MLFYQRISHFLDLVQLIKHLLITSGGHVSNHDDI